MNSHTLSASSRLLWLVFGELSSPAYMLAGHILSFSNGKPEFAMTDKQMAGVIFPELDADSARRRIRRWKRALRVEQEAKGKALIQIESGSVSEDGFVPTVYRIDFASILASGERE